MIAFRPFPRATERFERCERLTVAERVIAPILVDLGPGFVSTGSRERSWASATFTGARHYLSLSGSGDDAMARAQALRDAIGAIEFDVKGNVIADIAVTDIVAPADGSVRLAIEALAVEAC